VLLKRLDLPDFLKLSPEQKSEILVRLEKAAFFTIRLGYKHQYNGMTLIEYFFKYPFEFFYDQVRLTKNGFYSGISQKMRDINKQEINFLLNSIKTVFPFEIAKEFTNSENMVAGKGMSYVEQLLAKLRAENNLAESCNDVGILWNCLKKKFEPQQIIKFRPPSMKKTKDLISKDQGDLLAFAETIGREKSAEVVANPEPNNPPRQKTKPVRNKKPADTEDVQGTLSF
jgi:hypothetical protein